MYFDFLDTIITQNFSTDLTEYIIIINSSMRSPSEKLLVQSAVLPYRQFHMYYQPIHSHTPHIPILIPKNYESTKHHLLLLFLLRLLHDYTQVFIMGIWI